MTAIQRFAIHGTIMNPHSSGPYVRHEDHLAAMQGRCLAQIEEPARPVAPQGVPVGEIVLFGGDLKEVSWAGGKMPPPGTKLYAGAAPAAVAGQAGSEIDWDMLPENPGERARFDRQLSQLYGGDPRVFIATSLRLWAETRGSGFFGAQCAVFANEVAKMHIAAPALEAPAAPRQEGDVFRALIEFLLIAEEPLSFLRCWNEGSFDSCRREWPEAPNALYPLAAAPQAPAAPSEGLESLLNEALAEMKHIAETEQVSLTPTFHNEVRRPHDKRKFHMGDARRAARNAVSALEKAFAVVIASNAAAPAAPAVDASTVADMARALEMLVGSDALHSLCEHEGIDAIGRVKGTWSKAAECNARSTLLIHRKAIDAAIAAQAAAKGVAS